MTILFAMVLGASLPMLINRLVSISLLRFDSASDDFSLYEHSGEVVGAVLLLVMIVLSVRGLWRSVLPGIPSILLLLALMCARAFLP